MNMNLERNCKSTHMSVNRSHVNQPSCHETVKE